MHEVTTLSVSALISKLGAELLALQLSARFFTTGEHQHKMAGLFGVFMLQLIFQGSYRRLSEEHGLVGTVSCMVTSSRSFSVQF